MPEIGGSFSRDGEPLTIRNVTLPAADQGLVVRDVLIEAGEIAAIETPQQRSGRTLEAGGLLLLPGLVDNHVHYREPGLEAKEGFASGSLASAQGGATTVLEIQNNPPYLDSPDAYERKRELAQRRAVIDVGLYATAHPGMLASIADLAPLCQALKIFMAGPPDLALGSAEELTIAFERAAASGMSIVLHAEDQALVAQGSKHYRGVGAKAFAKVRSPAAEIAAVERALDLVRATQARVHFFHVSTAGACERIAEGKRDGLPIGASTCPHYLRFDEEDVARRGAVLKCNPSIKSAADRSALIAAVKSGVIDVVSTDHAPHTLAEKQRPFDDAPSGIASADLFLPLMLTMVHDGTFDLATVIERCAAAPARWHGYVDRGTLQVGKRADLVLVDVENAFAVTPAEFASKAKLSPYVGESLYGRVMVTLRRGRVVVDRRRA